MLWVLLAIVGAAANAAFYIIVKKYITTLDPKLMTAIGFIAGGFLLLAISAVNGLPVIGKDYWFAVAVSAVLNIIGLALIFRALSSSDLSLAMPMLSFTPAFLIGTSFILLNEAPSAFGVAGILIIVGGSYVLNIAEGHRHLLDPVRAMFRDRGSWYMLIVAFLFAASINYDKIAMQNSDPVFGMAATLLIIGGAFAGIAVFPRSTGRAGPGSDRDRCALNPEFTPSLPSAPVSATVRDETTLRPYLVPAILIAIIVATESISINFAYTLQIVPYVIALKRLAIIFMVLYGTLVCREEELRTRLTGSALMVAGAVIIIVLA